MPAFLFAGLYLAYSFWASKNKRDNINHDAHFDGAIFGLLFVLVTEPAPGSTACRGCSARRLGTATAASPLRTRNS